MTNNVVDLEQKKSDEIKKELIRTIQHAIGISVHALEVLRKLADKYLEYNCERCGTKLKNFNDVICFDCMMNDVAEEDEKIDLYNMTCKIEDMETNIFLIMEKLGVARDEEA